MSIENLWYHNPMTLFDKIKQKTWDFVYSFFLPIRKFLLKIGIIWHKKGRQKYHIGWLAPGKTLEGLKTHLHEKWGSAITLLPG